MPRNPQQSDARTNNTEAPGAPAFPTRGDTITALATAPGVGALAIVRLSGHAATSIAAAVVDVSRVRTGEIAVRTLRTPAGETLDQAVVLRYEAPRSYTGEDAVEFICHGGPVTAARLVEALVGAGARPAERGEFTRRAVLNGRVDLLQAEAVNDLIEATSRASARLALDQMDGGLSRRLEALRARIVEVEALIGYDIDFPEEDDGPIGPGEVAIAVQELDDAIGALIATAPIGELVRHGASVVIVGAPNVGKSSLFNALLGNERAIVTDIPGTTRDALEAVLDVAPIPLRLVDTAGIRDTDDRIEQLGVEVSRSYVKGAALVLACGDTDRAVQDATAVAGALTSAPILAVRTKSDLNPSSTGGAVAVSAVTGQGLGELIERVEQQLLGRTSGDTGDVPVVSHARYRAVLNQARDEIHAFRASRQNDMVPATIGAVHLRTASTLLGELLGRVDVEEILGAIFSRFCVGK